MRQLRPLIAGLLATLALGLAPMEADASPGSDMLRAVNAVRTSHNLHPVAPSASLSRSSAGYARVLASTRRFGHASYIPGFRTAAEVLEWHSGRSPLVSQTLSRWLASPPHRAAILAPRYRYAGFGVAATGGRSIWVGRLGS